MSANKLNAGDPAFPCHKPDENRPGFDSDILAAKNYLGMSLRAYATIHLASGQLANSPAMKALYDDVGGNFPIELARRTVVLADALLAELQKAQ
jgi:hypothetical protein